MKTSDRSLFSLSRLAIFRLCAAAACLLAQPASSSAANAQGQSTEFLSISVPAAILYDAPALNAKRLYVAPRGMPVQALTVVEPFIKVRDMTGDVAWVDRRALSTQRTVIATTTATVRTTTNEVATILVQVERGVILEVLEAPAGGWVKVRHSDGASGFVKVTEVWGL